MASNRTTVIFNDDVELEIEKGLSLYELSKIYQPKMKYNIVGAEIDNETVPMGTKINKAPKLNLLM